MFSDIEINQKSFTFTEGRSIELRFRVEVMLKENVADWILEGKLGFPDEEGKERISRQRKLAHVMK